MCMYVSLFLQNDCNTITDLAKIYIDFVSKYGKKDEALKSMSFFIQKTYFRPIFKRDNNFTIENQYKHSTIVLQKSYKNIPSTGKTYQLHPSIKGPMFMPTAGSWTNTMTNSLLFYFVKVDM